MKEQILSVSFDSIPDVRVRVIDKDDIDEIKKQKKHITTVIHHHLKVAQIEKVLSILTHLKDGTKMLKQ